MAHYDCSCCGEYLGISHEYCDKCKAGRCHLSQQKKDETVFNDMANQPDYSALRFPPTKEDMYAPLLAPAAHALTDPVPGTLPTGLPAYDYEVKSWPSFFSAMIAGKKMHDFRDMRDRTYSVGDRMLLREYDPFGGGYSGRVAIATITYITNKVTPCAMSSAVLDPNFCVLSVRVSGPYPDDDRNA